MQAIRKTSAKRNIEKSVAFAMGAGLVPIPFVDFGALVAILIKMVQNLAKDYNIEADRRKLQAIILPLLKSPGITSLAIAGLGSLAKFIPGAGVAIGAGTTAVIIGTLTYATGRVFALHFEKGGDLYDFNLAAQKKIFVREFRSGKKMITKIKVNKPATEEVKDPIKEIPIYLILKPNLGANGKVYLKTYYKGKRYEKYLGTIKTLEERYETSDLQDKEDNIVEDHQNVFHDYVRAKIEQLASTTA